MKRCSAFRRRVRKFLIPESGRGVGLDRREPSRIEHQQILVKVSTNPPGAALRSLLLAVFRPKPHLRIYQVPRCLRTAAGDPFETFEESRSQRNISIPLGPCLRPNTRIIELSYHALPIRRLAPVALVVARFSITSNAPLHHLLLYIRAVAQSLFG